MMGRMAHSKFWLGGLQSYVMSDFKAKMHQIRLPLGLHS